MKIKKRVTFGLLFAFCIGLLAFPFSIQAAAPYIIGTDIVSQADILTEADTMTEADISPWARDGVFAAYEAGLLAQSFDLGQDYSEYITRLQLARLVVDFVAAKKNVSALTLADEFELVVQVDAEQAALPELETSSFLDTKNLYAELALKLKLMEGANDLFRPNDMITRAEAATILQRCMTTLEVTEANVAPMTFTDSYAMPRWAVEAVKFVSGRTGSDGKALMGGTAGLFDSEGNFTIEQAILTLLRMHETTLIETVYPDWRNAPGYNEVQVNLSFGGDCTFGRGKDFSYIRSFDEMYANMGEDYFFSGIEQFFNDDLTMVNFEGTLTNATSAAVKTFVFKGLPEYAKILPAGSIDVVTIANNHSMDYLQKGFDDTLQNLSPYVAVSGYERMPIVTVKGVKIGFASNVGWSFDAAQKKFITNAIANLRAAGADLVVFNYHWGIEREYQSNATQRAIAHYCIDQGADLVIGHHPHVVQETETYKGKQIAYSLGNLVFGGNHNPADKNCLIFSQSFTLDLDTHAVLSETHTAIPYRVSSVTGRNDYHPVPAD